jgi:hypothetical protein
MLKAMNNKRRPVNAVLRYAMIVNKEPREGGEVVELSYADFTYLNTHERVFEATPENIALVKDELRRAKEAVARRNQPSDTETLKARIANLEAELAVAKKGK